MRVEIKLVPVLLMGLFMLGCASMKKSGGGRGVDAVTVKSGGDILLVADFDAGRGPNNIGGSFGSWDKDPNDETQGFRHEFSTPGYDGTGQCLRLTYDVESPNPAYGGFWMKLENSDARPYSKLSFWIKGDANVGYTNRLKVELKNNTGMSPFYLTNITDEWDVVEIPLSSFSRITDWSRLTEFVVVFEDSQATKKTGAIYIDDISFVK